MSTVRNKKARATDIPALHKPDPPRTDGCPHCGEKRITWAKREDDGRIQFYCGSGEAWRSSNCRLTERAQKAEAELERLREQLQQAVDIAEEFWNNQKQAITVYHKELADELDQLKATMNHDKK